MEDETNLRDYVHLFLRRWRVIAAATLLAGMAALAISSMGPANYQATAVVLLTRALYQIQLSPEIPNLSESSGALQGLTGKAALDLATSDAVLQQVLLEIGHVLPNDQRNLSSLRRVLTAEAGRDPSIVNLSARNRDAQQAANIANTWARVYAGQVNEVYLQPADQIAFFEGQLAQARSDLEQADQALVEFQKRNDSSILQAQLNAKQSALGGYLAMNETLVLLQQNVQDLQDQLARRPTDAPAELGDDLAQLFLQISTFGATASDLPILLQLPGTGGFSDRTVGEQAAYLAELSNTIDSKQAEVKKQVEALPVEIRALQGQIQEISTEAGRFTRQRDLAYSVYTTLAQKAKETEISAQDTSRRVRLASSAVTPDRPMSRGRLIYTALGLMVGFFVSIMVVLAIEYLRGPEKATAVQRPEYHPVAEVT